MANDIPDLGPRLAKIESVLAKVAEGDFQQRVEVRSQEDALSRLEMGVSFLIMDLRSLDQAKKEKEERLLRQQRDLEEKLALIEAQRAAIAQLSTPIIQVWDEILCLPVVGTVDTARSAEMTDRMLDAVVRQRARAVVVDITGIEVMDTKTADHFVKMARAVKLLGAEPIVTGISPSIAQTLTHIGVELAGIRTLRSLRDALRLLLEEDLNPSSQASA